MADKYKKTLLLVTHDRDLASGGDKIYTITAGQLTSVEM